MNRVDEVFADRLVRLCKLRIEDVGSYALEVSATADQKAEDAETQSKTQGRKDARPQAQKYTTAQRRKR